MRLVGFAVALCITGCCMTYGGPLAKPDTKPCGWVAAADRFNEAVLGATPEEQAQSNQAILGVVGAAIAPSPTVFPTQIKCRTICNPRFTNCSTVCKEK